MRLHVCRQPTYRQPAYSEVLQPSDSDETWESDRTWSSYEDNGDEEDTDEGEDEDEDEDQLCSALAPEPAGRAMRPRSKKQPAWAPEPAAWASNLTDEEAAEWMIDCYRLRLDDDLFVSGWRLQQQRFTPRPLQSSGAPPLSETLEVCSHLR